ncbi:hypothetical protein GCM10010974_22190 [Brevibacterium sediminis]|uniref:HAD family hydrolase n=2 Tax=Brevibacteriaceae TaxID=85019 RepID=A0ABQ1MI14_9MICO|nr:hypothetical protein GCM10010974_22190 [Brevibacterium sediminis]
MLCSHETGLLKPEPEAYENALERMRADAGDVFFIDDHEVCAGVARDVGANAIVHLGSLSTITAIEEPLRWSV